MATFLAHITVKPGYEADFEAIVAALYVASHTAEPGLRRYEYWRGADPRTYYTHASFDDFGAFLDHQVSDHHESALPKLTEVVESIRLEWVDPIVSASPLVPTDTCPLTDGASEVLARYHDRYAAEIQDWWLPLRG